jgi:hypothetical protein
MAQHWHQKLLGKWFDITSGLSLDDHWIGNHEIIKCWYGFSLSMYQPFIFGGFHKWGIPKKIMMFMNVYDGKSYKSC